MDPRTPMVKSVTQSHREITRDLRHWSLQCSKFEPALAICRLPFQCSELLGNQSLAPRSFALKLYRLRVPDELTTRPWGCKREPQNPKSKSLPILSFLGKGLIFVCMIYSLISIRLLVLIRLQIL